MLCLLVESEHVDAVITQAAADGANCPGRRAKSPRSMGSHLCTTEDTHSVPMTSFKRQMGRPATRETGNNVRPALDRSTPLTGTAPQHLPLACVPRPSRYLGCIG